MNIGETALLLITICVGVLVGVTIPVLLELKQTLRSARTFLDQTGSRLERALEELTTTTSRANRILADVEDGVKKGQLVLSRLENISTVIDRVQSLTQNWTLYLGALIPAAIAALRNFFSEKETEEMERKTR